MRAFSESEQSLLRIVEQFNRVAKYHGITPEEFLISFVDRDIEGLLDDEILEKAKLKTFSQRIKGLRFTPQGMQLWLLFTEQGDLLPVITRTGLLVRDIFLRNRLSYTDEAEPKSKVLKYHSKASLLEAFELGLVAKVMIKQKKHNVVKGYVVTSVGYAYLKGNKFI